MNSIEVADTDGLPADQLLRLVIRDLCGAGLDSVFPQIHRHLIRRLPGPLVQRYGGNGSDPHLHFLKLFDCDHDSSSAASSSRRFHYTPDPGTFPYSPYSQPVLAAAISSISSVPRYSFTVPTPLPPFHSRRWRRAPSGAS